MHQPRPGSVSAVVVAYNGGSALHDCVESLLNQTIPVEIIVVDNASTEGSVERLQQFGDGIRIIRRETNSGYAAGANIGWRAATGDLVSILNQDLVLMPDCLERMGDALLASDQEAIVTPKLVLKSDPARVNAIGNEVHLSGVAWCNALYTLADAWHGTIEVTAISGAAFMARVAFLHQLEGLEESYFMYMEDVDFSLRARLAGGICLAACDAVAIHDWKLSLDATRFEQMERNRRALWHRFWGRDPRMLPLLVQAELMAWLYAVTHGIGHVRAKLRAGRQPHQIASLRHSPSPGLLSVLARRHPYDLLLTPSPVVVRLGHLADWFFSAHVRPKLDRSIRPARRCVSARGPERDGSNSVSHGVHRPFGKHPPRSGAAAAAPDAGIISGPDPSLLVFVTPFASHASVRHAERLLAVLLPNATEVLFMGDRRVRLRHEGRTALSSARLPTLHALHEVRPRAWSAALWLLKLSVVTMLACTQIWRGRQRAQVLICYSGSYSLPLLLTARVLRIRTVVYDPGSDIDQAKSVYHGWFGRILVRSMALLSRSMHRVADYSFIQSARMAHPMGLRPERSRVRIATTFVDLQTFSCGPLPTNRAPLVGFVGRLTASKNPLAFAAAFELLADPTINGEIIGDGPLRDRVVAKAAGLPERLRYLGSLEQREVANRLQHYRLVVLPSMGEGLPNSVLEAMASGAVVISTPVGGVQDVIEDEVTGFLLAETHPEAIRDAISRALNHPNIDLISQQALDLIHSRFSLRASQARWTTLLSEVTGS